MGLNSEDGHIKRYAFIFTIYLYYLVYQTWTCTLVQVSVVQSSASTPPTSVPPTHTMLAGKRAGGERKIIMYGGTPAQFFFQCVDLVIFQFSKHVHHVWGNALVYKFVQVFG